MRADACGAKRAKRLERNHSELLTIEHLVVPQSSYSVYKSISQLPQDANLKAELGAKAHKSPALFSSQET